MIIAIASTREPKVLAVQKAIPKILHILNPDDRDIIYHTFDISGGTSMPRTLDEMMSGAYNRVVRMQENIKKQPVQPDYFIGMEGGFHAALIGGSRKVFLQSWAYISDGEKGFFGSSGNIEVPDNIAGQVIERGRELGVVIDEVAKQNDIRSKQGTWGVLTRDLVTRTQSFESALIAAFAPFYNPEMYF